MSEKIFVHKYVKKIVYVCVTGLGCIIGYNVGMSNKIFMYRYVKMFVYTHVTGLGYIRLCGCMYYKSLGIKHLYVLGCIIGHVVWVIRHSNM